MLIDFMPFVTLIIGIWFIFISVIYLLIAKYKSKNKERAKKLRFYGLLGLLTGIILTFVTIILDYI